jgi:hypothetical protein
MLTITRAVLASVSLLAVPLAAQDVCGGPGAAFGVVSHQCGDCSVTQEHGESPVWQFRTEPLILKTAAGSILQSGDIVEAVNDAPITTPTGAALFVRPSTGTARITVRRAGRRTTLDARVDCAMAHAKAELPAPEKTLAPGEGTRPSSKERGRFGFAIACSYCTLQVGRDGIGYWTFSSEPVIGDVDRDGPAARMGLRASDVIVAVDGHPVLERAGADALARSVGARTLRLTVHRDGRAEITVDLTARPGAPQVLPASRKGRP